MAIIKCPECGHQISDKAPTCPSCGVEIAGKITKCPKCGEIYLSYQKLCPNCYVPNPGLRDTDSSASQPFAHSTAAPVAATVPPPSIAPRPIQPRSQQQPRLSTPTAPPPPPPATSQDSTAQDKEAAPKKQNRSIVILSFVFAVIVCGILYYFYDNANKTKEKEAYEYAMRSSSAMDLQSYLDIYKDAPQEHIDSIQAHLSLIKQGDTDWTNALVSDSREALQAYLQKYPNSSHKQEAINKIDSIDWALAKSLDTVEGYQAYLDAHADGSHIEEAENALKKVKGRDLQPEEKEMVSAIFRKFFMAINSHDSSELTDACEDVLSSLLGKSSATKADVITFMDKLYKDNVVNMTWSINNDYQITKREVGVSEYEYQVQFTAHQAVDLNDGSRTEHLFRINGVVSPEGKVSSFNMSKVNVGE